MLRQILLAFAVLCASPAFAVTVAYEQSGGRFDAYPDSFGYVRVVESFPCAGGGVQPNCSDVAGATIQESAISLGGGVRLNNGRLQRVAGGPTQSTTLSFGRSVDSLAIYVGGLSAGERIQITFSDATSSVSTVIDGSIAGNGNYLFTEAETASGLFSDVLFADAADSPENAQINLDAIGVSAIPLPAAGWFLLGGVAGLAAFGRRRRS